MLVLKTKKSLKSELSSLKRKNGLGLVPTMGALHEGHLALVRTAITTNDSVVVSIFVNPTQFDNKDDLRKYPKTLKADMALLQSISEDIIIFAPTVKEIYASQVTSKYYNFDGLDNIMEGQFRKGHFEGVCTIIEALLSLVGPNRVYFGEKDFQQLTIIKNMVKELRIPVDIVGCPIIREPSGLAMSSRNERLNHFQRKEAAFIYQTLQTAKIRFGTENAHRVKEWVRGEFGNDTSLRLEYFEIADELTLKPFSRKQKNRNYRAFIAVYANEVRLIDNIALN